MQYFSCATICQLLALFNQLLYALLQYILAAPTSIATKSGEPSLTYINQAQSYEIKIKKLGDLSGHYRKGSYINIDVHGLQNCASAEKVTARYKTSTFLTGR